MIARRKDFMKLLVFVLIVIGALAVHQLVSHGLESMKLDGASAGKILGAKIFYVIGSLLTLWVLKSST